MYVDVFILDIEVLIQMLTCSQFSESTRFHFVNSVGIVKCCKTIIVIEGPTNKLTGLNFYCQLLTLLVCALYYVPLIACPINVTAVQLRLRKKKK